MIKRAAESTLLELSRGFPIIALVGPRQSGKTTLAQACYPDYEYFSLEDIDTREEVLGDERGFLERRKCGFILDEVQHAPNLFSYLQGYADRCHEMGKIVLTGSQNFLMMERITQSLAGRVGSLELLPFAWDELDAAGELVELDEQIFRGGYPPIYDRKIKPELWYPRYVQTYIDRDVRSVRQISDLAMFQKFIRLCAGRIGQLLNFSSLANECGVDTKTAQSWLSVLETSYVVFQLPPYHKNFNKRIVKQPKLYFHDTGLACSLLGIQSFKQIETHYMRGSLFENAVIVEYLKKAYHAGLRPRLFFWRDHRGREIDLIEETGEGIHATEMKSGATIQQQHLESLRWFSETAKNRLLTSKLIYGGTRNTRRDNIEILSWHSLEPTG